MSNYQVCSGGIGALNDIQRRHHRYSHSGYWSLRVAGLECVYRGRRPRDADVLLNSLNYLLRSDLLRLAAAESAVNNASSTLFVFT